MCSMLYVCLDCLIIIISPPVLNGFLNAPYFYISQQCSRVKNLNVTHYIAHNKDWVVPFGPLTQNPLNTICLIKLTCVYFIVAFYMQ